MSISLIRAGDKLRFPTFLTLLFLLITIRLLIESVTWQGTVQLHSVMEFIAATISLFVGMLALLRYFVRREWSFLFISAGFTGAGMFDGYHAMVAASFFDATFPITGSGNLPWSWNASPLFLSLLMLGSWLVRGRREHVGRIENTLRRVTIILLPAALLFYATFSLFGRDYFNSLPGQIASAFATLFFLWALLGYLVEGRRSQRQSEEWLVRGLLIIMAGQSLFMFYSQELFDALFTAAVALKQLGYLCVLTGLLGSLYTILKQTEQTSSELNVVNQSLQWEVVERKRAEENSDRQRQLAEALREVGIALSAALEFDDLLDALLDQIGRVLSYDHANVVMITGQDNVLQSTRVPGQGRHAPEELIQTALQYMQEIADSKQPLVIPNTETDNRRTHKTAKVQFKSWAGAPVVLQGEVVALLTVSSSSPEMYRPNDAAVLTAFAGQAAIAIKNARLYNEVQQHVEQLKKLTDITQRITATLDVTETLNLVTEKTAQLLAADIVSVILVDGAQDKPWLVVASGPAAAFSQEQREPDIHSLAGRAIAGGVSLLLMDMGQEDEWHTLLVNDDNYLPRSAICVPLRNRDQVVGAIEVLSRIPQAFDENDLQLLTLLARPAATAMENAQLYEKARQEISDRKRAEAALAEERAHLAQHVEERTAELKVAVAELARASRLKDDFLASMSHELRTPLNTILGMVEALQDSVYGPLNKNQGSSLQAIGESGTHLLSLINDILDVSKIEGGKLELEPLPVSVRSVCEASVRFVSREAHKKQLDVNLDLDQAPDSIMVDERRFKQILVNLLSNAVKFTPAGGRVGLRVWADAASQLVHFEVWDTGIGLAPEEIERLFQPFMQVDSRLSREYNGTGLGLALVYRLTRLHEGSVVVDSEVGSGSQFTISLPWQASSDSHDVGQSYKVETRPPGLAVRTDHSPVRILLAEDNEVAITAVTDYLSVLGHKIMAARTGREAVDIAIRSRPDIILMDVAMPKMDGLEAIRLIRKTDGLKDTPIVAVTALAMTGDKERCLRAGATDYLSKPISLKLLVEMIQRYTPLSDAEIAAGQEEI